MTSTYFALLAEFGSAHIPVLEASKKYFGVESAAKAKQKANAQDFPIPAFRGPTQKCQWLFDAADLALYLDNQRQAAREQWEKFRL